MRRVRQMRHLVNWLLMQLARPLFWWADRIEQKAQR